MFIVPSMDVKTSPPDLSPREREILNLILGGLSLKEIASKLSISYKGVDFHRAKLYRKLGIQSMQELLVIFANREIPGNISNPRNVFTRFNTFKDNLGSSISVTEKKEKIKKNTFTCYYIKGILYNDPYAYTGIYIHPDLTTLEVMKKSTFFSFNILGDGNVYEVMLITSDSKIQGEDNHFRKLFNTEKNKVTVITVNINELSQHPLFGQKVPFVQSNVEGMQFQALSSGKFRLKIWDIRF